MKHRKRQNGSAHVIIIIILVLALTTALGWIFWQNFIQKDSNVKKSTNYAECIAAEGSLLQATYPEVCVTKDGDRFVNPDQKIKEGDLTIDACAKHEKICFKYPSSWTIEAKEVTISDRGIPAAKPYKVDDIQLTSADESMVLQLSSGLYGIGGSCEPENVENANFRTVQSYKLPIKNPLYSTGLKDQAPDVYVIAGVSGAKSQYNPAAIVSGYKSLAATGSHVLCPAADTFRGSNVSVYGNGKEHGSVSFGFGTALMGANGDSSYQFKIYTSSEEAERVLGQPVAKQAINILKTAHYQQ